jgi:hypothetical protein
VGFVEDEAALGHVSSMYFGFLSKAFHRLLHSSSSKFPVVEDWVPLSPKMKKYSLRIPEIKLMKYFPFHCPVYEDPQ